MNPISILLILLGVFAVGYLYVFINGLMRDARDGFHIAPKPLMSLVSFIANFFDTLGVGSYATTTSMVRFFKLMPDEKIPGSLNVGYVLPTIIQAYVTIHGVSGLGVTVPPVEVDPRTLISLILAAILGAWLGAGVVSSWPRRKIQLGMGFCLAAAAVIMVVRLTVFHSLDVGAIGLTGARWVIGMGGMLVLGALMTLGIGLYAPCLILVTLLGMNDKSGYPIMMGACAFLMPVAVVRFVRARAYEPKTMLSMALPGIIAVPLAFKWFQNLDMKWVKIVVIFVVLYASISMLLTAYRERDTAAAARPASLEEANA
ncbi:MAG: sulfite exporter TauE/SafE family protein [Gemmatimonadaceae bacterium]